MMRDGPVHAGDADAVVALGADRARDVRAVLVEVARVVVVVHGAGVRRAEAADVVDEPVAVVVAAVPADRRGSTRCCRRDPGGRRRCRCRRPPRGCSGCPSCGPRRASRRCRRRASRRCRGRRAPPARCCACPTAAPNQRSFGTAVAVVDVVRLGVGHARVGLELADRRRHGLAGLHLDQLLASGAASPARRATSAARRRRHARDAGDAGLELHDDLAGHGRSESTPAARAGSRRRRAGRGRSWR